MRPNSISSTRLGLAVALVLVTTACGGKGEPAQGPLACAAGATAACACDDGAAGTQTCAADGRSYEPCACQPAPPADRVEEALGDLAALRDSACACQDTACAEHVQRQFGDFADRYRDVHGDDDQNQRATLLAQQAMECLMNVAAGAGDDTSDAVPVAWTTTGVPGCDQYVAEVEQYLSCDKVPQAARDAARQGLDAMKQGWGDMSGVPDDVKQQAGDACLQAVDAMKQAEAAMGCPK